MCLILVLVLLISWSPIRARASALPEIAGVATKVIPFAKVVEPAALGVGGTLFCWVVAALGVGFTVYEAVQRYNDFQDYSGMLETSIYYYPDGSWSYGVDMDFVQSVRAFLFDTGVLVDRRAHGVHVSDDIIVHSYMDPDTGEIYSKEFIVRSAEAAVYRFRVCTEDGMHYDIFYSNKFFKVSYLGSTYATLKTIGDVSFYFAVKNVGMPNTQGTHMAACVPGDYHLEDTILPICANILASGGAPYIESPGGAQIEHVAPMEIPIHEGYNEWYTNARPATNPDTQEEITVLPIPLNPSADPETQIGTLTQPNIWQGTISDPMPDMQPDPNPNPDPGTGVPSDIGKYQIDLKDFFPFCIPFDLYDFFTCLNADPVTPVIEWVIPLPGGVTYPLEIDLSAFDGVAQLLRRLQLLLFCVGLAFKTRDLIKG